MMKPNGLVLYEAHHIARTQTIEPQFPIGKAFDKKAPCNRQIEDHGCWRKFAFSLQVLPELSLQPLGRRKLGQRSQCNDALLAQKLQQPAHNSCITRSVVPMM